MTKTTCTMSIRICALSLLAVAMMALPVSGQADEENQIQSELVKIVASLLEELHYSNPVIDDKISGLLFDEYLQRLDPNRHFFIEADVAEWKIYKFELDDMMKEGDAGFAFLAHQRLLDRIQDRLAYLEKTVGEDFDFDGKETMVLDREEEPWAQNAEALNAIWRKEIKNHLLQARLREIVENEAKSDPEKDKDDPPGTIPANAGEELVKRYQRYYKFLKNSDSYDVLENYLTTLAEIFDPHSNYLNWRTLEDFNISLKLSLEGIGAVLTNDDGYAKIVRIIPGGPADRQGVLKAGYRIIAVGQEDSPAESIIDIPLTRAVQKIRGKKGTKVTLTVLKNQQDVPFEIAITRDEIKLTEQAAQGETREISLENGDKIKVGLIFLPSFYSDFDGLKNNDPEARSTLRDVRKILDDMVQGGVAGVILDLRSNGGGSLEEVIDLAGLFIPSGPIVQIKSGESRLVRKDQDGGFAYDLPLIVMVDAFSASASEIFAAAIQDYGRGVIVGQRTYGKGTVQNLLGLERIGIPAELKPGALKYTMAKFYRITGASTQQRGVIPHIVYPSFFTAEEYGEAALKHVMPWDEIAPVNFSRIKFNVGRYADTLSQNHLKRVQDHQEFRQMEEYINRWNERKGQKSISLNLKERLAVKKEDDFWSKKMEEMLEKSLDPDQKDNAKKVDLYLEETISIMRDLLTSIKTDRG